MISVGFSLRSGAQTTPENNPLTSLLLGQFSKRVFWTLLPPKQAIPGIKKLRNDRKVNIQPMKPERVRGDPQSREKVAGEHVLRFRTLQW